MPAHKTVPSKRKAPNEAIEQSSRKKAILIALIAMVVLLVAWHIFLPLLGIVAVMTVAAWSVIVVSIFIVAAAVLLFYIFTGIGIAILCTLSVVWIIFAIGFFPFIFPLLIPLLIILLFVAFIRRKQAK